MFKKKVVYVLGGGAAFGFAHIGVLKHMEECSLKPHAIGGTSIGALLGALYAAGFNAENLEYVAKSLNVFTLARLFTPTFPKGGIVRHEGVRQFLRHFLGDIFIEDLNIPFFSVATDLVSGKEEVFTEGSLVEAVLPSMSIPILFEPYPKDDKVLIDGGLSNPVPADIGKVYGNYVISVDVLGSRSGEEIKRDEKIRIAKLKAIESTHKGKTPTAKSQNEVEELTSKMGAALRKVKYPKRPKFPISEIYENISSIKKGSLSTITTAAETVAYVSRLVAENKQRSMLNHTAIKVSFKDQYTLFDFLKAGDMIEEGYKSALKYTKLFKKLAN